MTDLKRTPLYEFHVENGGKMVPFAGYDMPVQYPLGVMKEHLHTRAAAGLFDVSHMGQVMLTSPEGIEALALALEALVPVDILALKPARQRYGIFTNDAGGILDDLMITNAGDGVFLVVNAACKSEDIAHLTANLPDHVTVTEITDRALLALQGPKAVAALAQIVPQVTEMRFMDSVRIPVGGSEWWISRSGYTGEDGFEISLPVGEAVDLAIQLTAMDEVELIGLGARDSLRLEAGLCLYGHDIDATTTPVEGNIAWAMQKARRTGGARAGGFPGADRILKELSEGGDQKTGGTFAARPCTDARGHTVVCDRRIFGSNRDDHLGWLWPVSRMSRCHGIFAHRIFKNRHRDICGIARQKTARYGRGYAVPALHLQTLN